MNIRSIISIAVLAFALLTTSSCESFLDKAPQAQLTQTAFPVSPSDALLATNAVYTSIRDWFFNSGGYPILDILSDDANKGSNPNDQVSNLQPYDNFKINTSQDGLDRWWSTLYEGIKRANVVISKVPSITMDATLKNRYLGEAKFLRAVFYFDLVRAFGGVPKVDAMDPSMKMARASKEEIYALIISDLQFALQNLTEKSALPVSELGRATKGAARGLLAKVYLFQHDFVNAEKYALETINSNEYSLEPVFTDANGVKGNNGVESVFEVTAMQVEGFENGGDQYANTQGVRGAPNKGWGFNRPSLDLRNSFEAGDPRLKGTIIDLGDQIDGVTILGDGSTPDATKDAQGKTVEVECYNRKVWVPGTNTITQWGHHRRLLRYADVLLMAAEALNENDKAAQALVYLNKVRARARQGNNSILPDVTTTDKNTLRDAILLERRHELAMEGHRYWDLIRTGKAVAVLGPLGFVANKYELLPIPQSQIDISQKTLTQNPNW